MKGFRLVRLENGQMKTIVHGVGGSRTLPFNEWMEAEVKWTHNPGSKDQPHFWCGFHVFTNMQTALYYRSRFTYQPAVVEVEYDDWWYKPTNPNVILCRYLKITAVKHEPR